MLYISDTPQRRQILLQWHQCDKSRCSLEHCELFLSASQNPSRFGTFSAQRHIAENLVNIIKEMLVTVHLAPGIRQSLCEDQGPLVQRVVVVQAVHVLVVVEFFISFFGGKTQLTAICLIIGTNV